MYMLGSGTEGQRTLENGPDMDSDYDTAVVLLQGHFAAPAERASPPFLVQTTTSAAPVSLYINMWLTCGGWLGQ